MTTTANDDIETIRAELNRMYSADMAKLRAQLGDALNRARRAETDAAEMTRANQEITAERDRMRAVAAAALQWRRHYGNTSDVFGNACAALVAAVDALPEEVTR